MLGNYVLNYGPFEGNRVKYWLLAAHLVEKCGMTVDELNNWLTPPAAAAGDAKDAGASVGSTSSESERGVMNDAVR
jgi:hypothetical protein